MQSKTKCVHDNSCRAARASARARHHAVIARRSHLRLPMMYSLHPPASTRTDTARPAHTTLRCLATCRRTETVGNSITKASTHYHKLPTHCTPNFPLISTNCTKFIRPGKGAYGAYSATFHRPGFPQMVAIALRVNAIISRGKQPMADNQGSVACLEFRQKLGTLAAGKTAEPAPPDGCRRHRGNIHAKG